MAWAFTLLPVAIIAYALAPLSPGVAGIVVWWFKPLFTAAAIRVASRAMFQERTKVRDLFDGATLARTLPYLTYARFTPFRGSMMALKLLERPKGLSGRQRVNVLRQSGSNDFTKLTAGLLCIDLVLRFALIGSAVALSETMNLDSFMIAWENGELGPARWSFVAGVLATTLVEPVYACASFFQYLSSRNEAEGWDLEVRFRSMAQRFFGPALALAVLLAASVAQADESPVRGSPKLYEIQSDVERVLDGDDFNQMRDRTVWRRRGRTESKERRESGGRLETSDERRERERAERAERRSEEERRRDTERQRSESRSRSEHAGGDSNGASSSSGGQKLLRAVFLVLVALVIGVFLLAILSRLRGPKGSSQAGAPRNERVKATRIESVDVPQRMVLPAAPGDRAWQLWQSKAHRQALSTLYISLVSGLGDHGVEVLDHWTEGDVMRAAAALSSGEQKRLVHDVVHAWSQVAYAHGLPTDEHVRDLCKRWSALAGRSA